MPPESSGAAGWDPGGGDFHAPGYTPERAQPGRCVAVSDPPDRAGTPSWSSCGQGTHAESQTDMQTLATHSPFDNIRFELRYVPSQRDAQTLVEEETLCDDELEEDYPGAHFSFPNPDHFLYGGHEFFQTPTDLRAFMQPEYIYEQPPPVPPTHQPYASPLTSAPLTPTATVGTRFTITVDLDALPVEYMEPTFLPDYSFRHVQYKIFTTPPSQKPSASPPLPYRLCDTARCPLLDWSRTNHSTPLHPPTKEARGGPKGSSGAGPTGSTTRTTMRLLTTSVKLDPAVPSLFNEQQGMASAARSGMMFAQAVWQPVAFEQYIGGRQNKTCSIKLARPPRKKLKEKMTNTPKRLHLDMDARWQAPFSTWILRGQHASPAERGVDASESGDSEEEVDLGSDGAFPSQHCGFDSDDGLTLWGD